MDELLVDVPQPGLIWIFVHATVLLNTFMFCQNQDISFSQTEESPAGTYVGEVLGKTNLQRKYKSSTLDKIRFNFVSPNEPGVNFFRIIPERGEIYTTSVIDRDTLCDVVSTCCADSDGCRIILMVGVSPQEYFSIFNVRINITDINDNKPNFQESSFSIRMPESSAINSSFKIPIALDLDVGINDIQKYALLPEKSAFRLREYKSGNAITDVAITNIQTLDRETQVLYRIKVIATDGGIPQQTGTLVVNIELTDVNDNRPVFRNSLYKITVKENVAAYSTILQIKADDPDIGINSQVRYAISRGSPQKVKDTFSINDKTGWIKLKMPLNYEETKTYLIDVEAIDIGSLGLPCRAKVSVVVSDVNDNSPTILVNTLSVKNRAEVKESKNSGEIAAHIIIQDDDSGDNGRVSCSVDNSYFSLTKERNIGRREVYKLITTAPLNRETTPEYLVTVVCQDMGQPRLESRETFTVTLLDVNDNAPVFSQRTYEVYIDENNKQGAFLVQIHADDKDVGKDGTIDYTVANDGKDLVTINQEGKIYAATVFDREQHNNEIKFHVLAVDRGEPPLTASANIILHIKDQNDNAPYIMSEFTFNVSENAKPHTVLGSIKFRDRDLGQNSVVDFFLYDDSDLENRYFSVSLKGTVITRNSFDREHKDVYYLNVRAKDRGRPPQTSVSRIKILVLDENDNRPVIRFPNLKNDTIYISYLKQIAQPLVIIDAVDADTGKNGELIYYIIHGNEGSFFAVNERTGVLFINRHMRVEDAHGYKLTIEVRDKGQPFQSATATFIIIVDGTGKPITLSGAYIESKPNTKNLIMIICLASVAGLLATVLIVAILCIRHKDVENHRYNIKTETQRVFNNRHKSSPTMSMDSVDELRAYSPTHKKEVSFLTDNDDTIGSHSTFKAPRMLNWDPNMKASYEVDNRDDFPLSEPTWTENNSTFSSTADTKMKRNIAKAVNV